MFYLMYSIELNYKIVNTFSSFLFVYIPIFYVDAKNGLIIKLDNIFCFNSKIFT